MGWISTLYETYNNCSGAVGKKTENGGVPLLPVSHSTAQAQIEVKIDLEGNFVNAEIVAKDDALTIIPVTEDSCTRSSGIAPHPLCDKLCYITADYDRYITAKKSMTEYFSQYISALKKWSESEYSTEKVTAIYKYLCGGTLVLDLINKRIFETDEKGKLSNKKIEGVAQSDCFVRFSVNESETWKDKELFDSFVNYYDSFKEDKSICYVLGENAAVTEKYPAKIRHTGDKAKIISSNDSVNFTYRGRFLNPDDAATVSYDVSQKAHNVLKWLIAKQGYKNDSNYIVSWSTGGEKIINYYEGSDGLSDDEDEVPNTAELYAKSLNKAIAGYGNINNAKTKIAIMSLDTADGSTNGRLSIKMYTELTGSQFLENIKSWYKSCYWKLIATKKVKSRVASPSPVELISAAYGTDREGLVKVEPKLMKTEIERILPCIIQKRKFPKDIMLSAVRNISRPECFTDYNHKRLLAVTCAMIKKYYYEEEDVMGLDEKKTDRSYLFGRLLAIADVLEERTYEAGEKRPTNAVRYWSAFAVKPAKTWEVVMGRLRPYMDKCDNLNYYNKLFGKVHSMFEIDGFSNEKLSPEYVFGYWCQRNDMYTKKEEEN